MKLPALVKGFNLFVEGLNMHGLLVDITRPKIVFKMEEYQAGGQMTPVEVMQGLEKLELEITCGGITAEIIKSMGGTISGKTFRYQGAIEEDDTMGYKTLMGEGRGRIVELDKGDDKQGDNTETKFRIALTYWKETINGEVLTEIDARANKCFIGGVDQWSGLGQAIGLV